MECLEDFMKRRVNLATTPNEKQKYELRSLYMPADGGGCLGGGDTCMSPLNA